MAFPRLASEPLADHPRYTKLKDLNKGSYGFVQLAHDKIANEDVAIKFMQRGEKLSSVYVQREIENHSGLLHPHIIQFKEVFLTPDYLAIVMEYAKGGDMFQYVKARRGLQEHEARWFFQQLVIALDYLHRMGVVSRDIKLENTLLDGSRRPLLKICDFGYSKHKQKDSVPKSRVGTPGYTAPEIISHKLNNPEPKYSGEMVDVWSAGVMLYVMLFCQYPFERLEDEKEQAPTRRIQLVMQRVTSGDYKLPSSVPISPECKDLLARILTVDPKRRITVQQIQQHPWYLQDLPQGLSTFNDTCIAQQKDHPMVHQNKEHVRSIVQEARVSGRLGNISGFAEDSDDENLDDLMQDGSMEYNHTSF